MLFQGLGFKVLMGAEIVVSSSRLRLRRFWAPEQQHSNILELCTWKPLPPTAAPDTPMVPEDCDVVAFSCMSPPHRAPNFQACSSSAYNLLPKSHNPRSAFVIVFTVQLLLPTLHIAWPGYSLYVLRLFFFKFRFIPETLDLILERT